MPSLRSRTAATSNSTSYTIARPAGKAVSDVERAPAAPWRGGATATVGGLVIITQPADIITVEQAKAHLRSSSLDDGQVAQFISAACRMIVDRMGQVSPVTAVVELCPRTQTIVLEHRPVISITSVQELPGLAEVPQADTGAGADGWVLESAEGVMRHTSRWPRSIRVTYEAGRSPVPANISMAALELVGHLWRTSQLNGGGGRPQLPSDELVVPGVTYALPYNVRQLLGLDRRPQQEVVVG